jgi:magnesium-transporting ATPase (P-type)
LTNRYLLWGIAFAVVFAAAIIYLPPLQSIFSTAALPAQDLLLLACFPVIVWGSDELWRWRMRTRTAVVMPTARPRGFADDAPPLR